MLENQPHSRERNYFPGIAGMLEPAVKSSGNRLLFLVHAEVEGEVLARGQDRHKTNGHIG